MRYLNVFPVCLLMVSGVVSGDEWPGFLGDGGNRAAVDGVVDEFGKGKNVKWRVDVPVGHSSPCVAGGKIFLTAAEAGGRVLKMMAMDVGDGSLVWERTVEGEVESDYGHRAAQPAMSTACTDGERVFFYFGGYGLVACAAGDGEVLWEKRFGFEPQMFGTGVSPVLADGAVVLARDGGKDPAVWCFEGGDGAVRWKVPRPGFGVTYGSPYVWKNKVRAEVVVGGSTSLRSYALEDGAPLWSVADTCGFPCTTPVGDAERLYFAAWATINAEGEERAKASFWGDIEISDEEMADPEKFFARFDPNGDGKVYEEELGDSRAKDAFNFVDRNRDGYWVYEEYRPMHVMPAMAGKNIMVAVEAGHDGELSRGGGVAWTWDESLPYVASPLLLNGRVYLVKSGGLISCVDAATGEAFYEGERIGMSGEYYATTVAAGGKVLICSERGFVFVLEDGKELKVLVKNKLGEKLYATPAVAGGVLYIRTERGLWAIGEDQRSD